MNMRFLADENFRFDVVKFLKSKGHNVKTVIPSTLDKAVAQLAKKEQRILLTNDTDFLRTLEFPPHQFSGILVFRILPPKFDKFKKALLNFFSQRNIESITGKTFLIEEKSFLELEQ